MIELLTTNRFFQVSQRALATTILMIGLAFTSQGAWADKICPPCSGDADSCAFSCCLFQNCSSPAGASCVAFCALGKVLTDIFGSGTDITKFTSGEHIDEPEFCVKDASLYRMFDAAGNRKPVVLKAGYYDHKSGSFIFKPEASVGPEFSIVEYESFINSPDTAEWVPMGYGSFNRANNTWELPVEETMVLNPTSNYVVKADFAEKGKYSVAVIMGNGTK